MSESQITLVDPALLSNERLLVVDNDGMYNARIYQLSADRNHPMYTIRSRGSQKNITSLRCSLHSGIDGHVLGEMNLHGILKRGSGTVTAAGTRPVSINDWMKDTSRGRTFEFDGVSYRWSRPSMKSQPTIPILEVQDTIPSYLLSC